MKQLLLCVMANLFLCSSIYAEVAVIVHPSVNLSEVSQDRIQRVYLGKTSLLADGISISPINQTKENEIRKNFIENVLDKSAAQYRSYWSRLIFTGKGAPPKEFSGDSAIKTQVSQNPKLIGYIDSASVDYSVKVIFTQP